MRRIVVIGHGFAALHAAQRLEQALEGRRYTDLTLVTDRAHFVYTPLLPHVVSGTVEVTDIAVGFDEILTDETTIRVASVDQIEPRARRIQTDEGSLEFDYLIFAPDGIPDWGQNPERKSDALPFDTPTDAATLRGRLDEFIEEPRDRPRHVAIVGGGRTGVELTAELHRTIQARSAPSSSSDDPAPVQLGLFERRAEILQRLPEELRSTCRNWIDRAGVEIHTDVDVTACTDNSLELADGTIVDTDATIWCGGWRPPGLVDDFGPEEIGRASCRERVYCEV